VSFQFFVTAAFCLKSPAKVRKIFDIDRGTSKSVPLSTNYHVFAIDLFIGKLWQLMVLLMG